MKVQFGVESICQPVFGLCHQGHGEDDRETVVGSRLELIVDDVYDIGSLGFRVEGPHLVVP